MDLGLRDRVFLVTGGSRGLGFAAARALIADGARVVVSAPHQAWCKHLLRSGARHKTLIVLSTNPRKSSTL